MLASATPTACCSPTGRAIRRASTTPWRRCAGCWTHGGLPIFGICLGHQLLALRRRARAPSRCASGTAGVNQPVLETAPGRVVITTQNHGYVVDPAAIPAGYRVTHTNLNDGTVEGLAHRAAARLGRAVAPRSAAPAPPTAH